MSGSTQYKVRRRPVNGQATGASSAFTGDSFVNFAAGLGYGANNLTSASNYAFNPISRTHTTLEWAYRGSWIVKQVVDAVADDMTREGIDIESDMPPDEIDEIHQYLNKKHVWQRLNSTIKWSRLYGGCLAVIMIRGQKTDTPLRLETIGKDDFQGLRVLDRWMVQPHLELPVTDPADPDYGYPSIYEVLPDAQTPYDRVHHTRLLRLDGIELPYWQKIAENMWGLSVLEPLFDRLIAFDSTTTGVAQLVYRAHLRTMKIEKLRELIAFGGESYKAVLEQIKMIRLMQSNEGLTVIDSTDEFQVDNYNFAGLSDVLIQFSQQLSGATQIPLTRLFGQSPAGMNSTGESDLRNYYDSISAQQEARLRPFITTTLEVAYRSLTGKELPKGFNFSFTPLWQLDAEQKANVANVVTQAVAKAFEDGIIDQPTALKELRQLSKETGIYSNITDEQIKDAEEAPPMVMGMPTLGPGGQATGVPGQSQLPPQPGMPKPGQQPLQAQQKGGAQKAPDPPKAEHKKTTEVTKFAKAKDEMAVAFSLDASQGDDIILGSDEDSRAVWVVEEQRPGTSNSFKFLLRFADRESALDAYKEEHTDQFIGAVRRTNLNGLQEYKYMNGGIG